MNRRTCDRCSCWRMTGELCHWHRLDYLGAPRCGWAGQKIREHPRAKKFRKRFEIERPGSSFPESAR